MDRDVLPSVREAALDLAADGGRRANEGHRSFLWYLEPIDECRTRFIIRMRDKYRWFNPIMLPVQLAVDVVDIFFQWKHMLGVKARAERMAQQHQPEVGAQPAARPDAPASSLS